MKARLNDTLIPCCAAAPEGVHPFLILDSCKCHLMGNVVQLIENAGIQVKHVSGGCVHLCVSPSMLALASP